MQIVEAIARAVLLVQPVALRPLTVSISRNASVVALLPAIVAVGDAPDVAQTVITSLTPPSGDVFVSLRAVTGVVVAIFVVAVLVSMMTFERMPSDKLPVGPGASLPSPAPESSATSTNAVSLASPIHVHASLDDDDSVVSPNLRDPLDSSGAPCPDGAEASRHSSAPSSPHPELPAAASMQASSALSSPGSPGVRVAE